MNMWGVLGDSAYITPIGDTFKKKTHTHKLILDRENWIYVLNMEARDCEHKTLLFILWVAEY